MSLVRLVITDKSISSHSALPGVDVLRDNQNPALQLRFKKNRAQGVWRILYRNKWHRVAEWPSTKTREMRNSIAVLLDVIARNGQAKVKSDCFITLGDLLTWYNERVEEDANLSDQRKKDIKSSIKKHLFPRLGDLLISEVDKNTLDKVLIWPLQKVLAKSSVVKKFHILKAAAKKASGLDLLSNNPLERFKISDFGDFSADDKESLLKPRMVPWLLDEMEGQPDLIKMVCMLMLTLGTRIGETLLAKWSNFNLTFDPAWDIPKPDTKTKTPITIHLPPRITDMLLQWKEYQKQCKYNGKWLFPNPTGNNAIDYEKVRKAIHAFSAGEWHSHDLRKCARLCWEEQGVDGLVAERMLNHTLGKTTRAYTGQAYKQRKQALIEHTNWLSQQNKKCFILNPESTPSQFNLDTKDMDNVA